MNQQKRGHWGDNVPKSGGSAHNAVLGLPSSPQIGHPKQVLLHASWQQPLADIYSEADLVKFHNAT